MAYSVLAECKRHALRVATDLDIDTTILTEDLSDGNFKCLISLNLRETIEMSALRGEKVLSNLLGNEDATGGWEDCLSILGLEVIESVVNGKSSCQVALLTSELSGKETITTLSTTQTGIDRWRCVVRARNHAGASSPVVTSRSTSLGLVASRSGLSRAISCRRW